MTSRSASGGSDSDAEEEEEEEETPRRDAATLSPDVDKKKTKKKKKKKKREMIAMEEEDEEEKKDKKKGKERRKREEEKRDEEEEEYERPESVLLRGIFRLGKISHDVLLTNTRVSWTPILPEMPTVQVSESQSWSSISLRDVFAVKVKRRRSAGQQTGGPVLGVTLFYGRTTVGRRLTDDKLHLHNSSVQHCDVWFKTIKQILSGFSTRPKHLLVFINPGSHKKEAVHVYRQHVAPLFNMADLKTDITITEKKGHALSVLKECDLDEYDGVVCVGGDGSVAEIAHGLVLRAQLDDQEDPESWTLSEDEQPRRAPLPLGIIPAGSTDIVSCSVHGVRHAPTAALHIILGHLQPVDMCSFSSQGRLVTFGFSAMFGFGGRSLALAERKRWMPTTQRRDYALLKTLAKLRPVDCDLSFLPADSDQSSLDEGSKESQTEGEEQQWLQTNQGLYLNISVMSIPCLSPHTPYGLSKTRLANGSGELIAVGNTSRSEFIRHLKRYGSKTGQFDFPFVEKHTVAAVRLRPRLPIGWQQQEEESEDGQELDDPKATPILSPERKGFPWNIDGELICIPNEVLVRVHSSLITLYGGEVESAELDTVSCSCI